MSKLKIHFIVLSLAVFALSSCSRRYLDFTLISSKNIDLTKAGTFVKGKNRVGGKDMIHWVVVFPTGIVSVKEAVDKAIESTPGCVALLDGVIYTKFLWLPYVYGQQSVTVEGLPLIDPSLAINAAEIPTYGKIELDRNGAVKKVETLSANEYLALKGKTVKESQKTNFVNSKEVK